VKHLLFRQPAANNANLRFPDGRIMGICLQVPEARTAIGQEGGQCTCLRESSFSRTCCLRHGINRIYRNRGFDVAYKTVRAEILVIYIRASHTGPPVGSCSNFGRIIYPHACKRFRTIFSSPSVSLYFAPRHSFIVFQGQCPRLFPDTLDSSLFF
jgi:hypothetical protein